MVEVVDGDRLYKCSLTQQSHYVFISLPIRMLQLLLHCLERTMNLSPPIMIQGHEKKMLLLSKRNTCLTSLVHSRSAYGNCMLGLTFMNSVISAPSEAVGFKWLE